MAFNNRLSHHHWREHVKADALVDAYDEIDDMLETDPDYIIALEDLARALYNRAAFLRRGE